MIALLVALALGTPAATPDCAPGWSLWDTPEFTSLPDGRLLVRLHQKVHLCVLQGETMVCDEVTFQVRKALKGKGPVALRPDPDVPAALQYPPADPQVRVPPEVAARIRLTAPCDYEGGRTCGPDPDYLYGCVKGQWRTVQTCGDACVSTADGARCPPPGRPPLEEVLGGAPGRAPGAEAGR